MKFKPTTEWVLVKIIKTIFNNTSPHAVLIQITFYFYFGFLAFLWLRKILSPKEIIENFTTFLGWIVALLILWFQLVKTREADSLTQKKEIKKKLQIEAFKEINNAVTEFSNALINISTKYLTLPINLKLHIDNPEIFKFDKINTSSEFNYHISNLLKGLTTFIYSIEANEIAVIQYDHLRKKIRFEVDDTKDLIGNFQNFYANTPLAELKTTNFDKLKELCEEIHSKLLNIGAYLFDYRIELMNHFLGDVFDARVPERKPLDPSYKTLKEIAVKDAVEKEERRRELEAFKGNKK